jgi:hypothetical protein
MTDLNRPIRRRTASTCRERGRLRRIVATLYPSGVLGLRPERCRREETITLESCYSIAVKQRVAAERAARRKK